MRRILFIDRDGTLIDEPKDNFQVDCYEKLSLKPHVILALRELLTAGYELVMVTNQDGMGTDAFPSDNFWKPHNMLMQIIESQGVKFSAVLIDNSYESESNPNRKPGTGMLTKYFEGDVDLLQCRVIGDRITDIELAKRLQSSAVLFADGRLTSEEQAYVECGTLKIKSKDWISIATTIKSRSIIAVQRKSQETSVKVKLYPGISDIRKISTGVGFLDHMLEQFSFHSAIGLQLFCEGDLRVDQHHTIEDVAIVLGQALYDLWSNGQPLRRYGFTLPMDESLASTAIDLSGRPWLNWNVDFQMAMLGDFPTQMFKHFFYSLAMAGRFTIHISAEGENDHHKIEAVFKAFGRAVRQAIEVDFLTVGAPSTKGFVEL